MRRHNTHATGNAVNCGPQSNRLENRCEILGDTSWMTVDGRALVLDSQEHEEGTVVGGRGSRRAFVFCVSIALDFGGGAGRQAGSS